MNEYTDNAWQWRAEMYRQELNDVHQFLKAQIKDNEELYRQLHQLPPVAASINSPNGPGGILTVDELLMARNEIRRLQQTLQIYEDRLARYEGRPSPVVCPRACCANREVMQRTARHRTLFGGAA